MKNCSKLKRKCLQLAKKWQNIAVSFDFDKIFDIDAYFRYHGESSSTEKATKGTYKSSTGFYEYDGTILSEDGNIFESFSSMVEHMKSLGIYSEKDFQNIWLICG